MAKEDEVAFLRFAAEKYGLSLHDHWLKSSTCPAGGIQFLPSRRFGEDLTAGRIALATVDLGGKSLFSTEAPELEKTYRALRRYIQKNFSNKLAAYTDGQKSKYTYRDLWLGPCAQASGRPGTHAGQIRRKTAGEPASTFSCGRTRCVHGLRLRARFHASLCGTSARAKS